MATPLAPARHLKCPIDSRYTGSADSATQVQPGTRKRRARGRCGEPGVLPTGPAYARRAFGGRRLCLRESHRPEPDALARCPLPAGALQVRSSIILIRCYGGTETPLRPRMLYKQSSSARARAFEIRTAAGPSSAVQWVLRGGPYTV